MASFHGQGATEYLVILGTVLTISLISISLMASGLGSSQENRETAAKSAWQGASPIAIIGWSAYDWTPASTSPTYLDFKNNGNYPIRITRIFSGNSSITQLCCDPLNGWYYNMSPYLLIQPGEERTLTKGRNDCNRTNVICPGGMSFCLPDTPFQHPEWICNAKTVCRATKAEKGGYGYMEVPELGFEYIEYAENQQITKTQLVKTPLIIPCEEPV